MDLFVINRYEGEKIQNDQSDQNDQNHLVELVRRIEERKKRRIQNENTDNDPKNNVDCLKSSKKKKKKLLNNENESKITTSGKDKNSSEQSDSVIVNNKADYDVDSTCMNKLDEQKQDFVVLGTTTTKKKEKVRRILPKWLAKPEIISANLDSGPVLDECVDVLNSQLINTLQKNGISKLFPAQASLLNWMSKCDNDRKFGWWPRDTCVSAPTGSGKTLAYVLPIIQYLNKFDKFIREIRCLIVLPVHELANQIYNVIVDYSANTNLRVGLITGATSLEYEQKKLFKKTHEGKFISKVDIVVATSGRLIDHIEKSPGFSLENLEFLVIDEADKSTEWLNYFSMPHHSSKLLTINNYDDKTKVEPAQKLLFSATLSQDPENLNHLGLFQPILFTSVSISNNDDDINLDKQINEFLGRYTSPNELNERAVECSIEYKPVCLAKFLTLEEFKGNKTLIFTNSGESAHRLATLLQLMLMDYNITIDELSAQMIPKRRAQVLKKFTTGEIQVLVSSDALSRGLDIPGVKLVVSYDPPKHIKGYIHRAGRTGRAGLTGTAISILTSNQIGAFNRMLLSAHKKLPIIEHIDSIEIFANEINYTEHLKTIKNTFNDEQLKKEKKIKTVKRRKVNLKKNMVK